MYKRPVCLGFLSILFTVFFSFGAFAVQCDSGTFIQDDTCVTCPANSSSTENATECTCDIGYTADGQATTTTADCVFTPEFRIKTINMEPNTTFSFDLTAAGSYTIDWGDGYIDNIAKDTVEHETISHKYTDAGVRTIGMAGDATDYDAYSTAVSFKDNTYVAELDGSLGAIFGGHARMYMFQDTFSNCKNLTTIPATLFDGVTGAAENMFKYTFNNCVNLKEIPDGLFDEVSGGANEMFAGTFNNCASLTEIPDKLFEKIDTASFSMFYSTFSGCENLTKIPSDLFRNVTGSAQHLYNQTFSGCTSLQSIPGTLFDGVTGAAENMFDNTFLDCTSLQTIPSGLFDGVTGAAESMFRLTFQGCTSLQSIPSGLFDGVNGAAAGMFHGTFLSCTNLTEIPDGLFSGVSGAAESMFHSTFWGCSALSEIPSGLFDGVNGAAAGMFTMTFVRTGIEKIPSGLFKNVSGAADYMFSSRMGDGTFMECTKLKEVPADLFGKGITEAANMMFSGLFAGCIDLTSIPVDLFANITEEPGSNAFQYLFYGATNITKFVNADGNEISTYVPTQFFGGMAGEKSDAFTKAFEETQLATECPDGTINANPYYADEIAPKVVCVPEEFTITTIEMPANTTFSFRISAAGSYTIDWGDGDVKKIEKTDTNWLTVSHTYTTAGVRTIGMTGEATDYDANNAAIGFYGNTNIAELYGSLGAIFGDTAQPYMFRGAFSGCTNLTTIPSTLFSGVTGAANNMFHNTFDGCSALSEIPDGLFSGVKGAADYMFNNTFNNCSALSEIPDGLFSGVKGAADEMFSNTFANCKSLQSIPDTLFSGVSGAADYMFGNTFYRCTSLTEIPSTLFSGVSGAADYMFHATFSGCTSLQSIPSGLFSGVDGAANYMFGNTHNTSGTFAGCTSLTSIPVDLFKNVTGEPGTYAFANLFNGAKNITKFVDAYGNVVSTYVPTQFFGGMSGTNANAFTDAFRNTGLDESCPDGTINVNPYYATAIASKVVCEPFTPEFTITTIEDMADKTFSFTISAAGNYTIDWGDGNGQKIEKPDTTIATYTHTYAAAKTGGYTIGIAGDATDYNENTAAISFSSNKNIAVLGGSLGAIFGGAAENMFRSTFNACTSLQSIPDTLFRGVTGAAENMFSHTFYSCSALSEIPSGLFDGVNGAADYMFSHTFSGCSALSEIPSGLFSGVTGAAERMFQATFIGCTSLQSIPGTLFDGVTGAANSMFSSTFSICTSLESIPVDLFANITEEPVSSAFHYLFYRATGITKFVDADGKEVSTYVPTQFFGEMAGTNAAAFTSAFEETQLAQTCPDGTINANPYYATAIKPKVVCVPEEFTIKTINMAANTAFSFNLTAAGSYTIDWGDGYSQKIEKTDISVKTYKHTYATAGAYTIRMAGEATAYKENTAAISFSGNKNIAELDGSLGAIFSGPAHPYMFASTFQSCTNLTTIPETLFDGVTDAANSMFSSTFSGCTSLQSIPDTLFSGVTGAADYMFSNTFGGCASLQSIPSDLFSGVIGAAENMFNYTFQNCSNLTTIPESLFDGVTGAAESMFSNTFSRCTSLQSIPDTLFSGVSGAADYMFSSTFSGCTSLQSIPDTLFSGVLGAANYMFRSTFNGCTSLQSIPDTLFSGVTGAADYMFDYTFSGCTSLQSIPSDLFSGVIGAADSMFGSTFSGCTSLQSIPAGLFSGVIGAADYMFSYTFNDCTSLQSIPSGLFSGVSGAADYMFLATFKGCTSLEEIPSGLFSGVSGAANYMFGNTRGNPGTFADCKSLQSIPVDLFKTVTGEPGTNAFANLFNGATGITKFVDANGNTVSTYVPTQFFGGMDDTNAAAFTNAFAGTDLATECPDDYVNANPYYADAINPKVVCKFNPEFTITTINMEPNTTFSFNLTAAGSYVIDWGDGIIENIAKDTVEYETISHTYTDSGIHTIGIAGQATQYSDNEWLAAVSFAWHEYIASISGSLGAIFGTLDNGDNPRFVDTFSGTKITDVPPELFDGITGTTSNMFAYTFYYCKNLQTVHKDLFANVTKPAPGLFSGTFSDSGLVEVPIELFKNLGGTADSMFSYTFNNCANLEVLPVGLFDSVTEPAPGLFNGTFSGSGLKKIQSGVFDNLTGIADNLFGYTFSNCSKLIGLPDALFKNITGAASGVFNGTFSGSGLVEIPSDLFSGITEAINGMFTQTFAYCTDLESVPVNLFENIAGTPNDWAFSMMFYGDTNLSTIVLKNGITHVDYVPRDFFGNIAIPEQNVFYQMFDETKLATQCPRGFIADKQLTEYLNYKAVCAPAPKPEIIIQTVEMLPGDTFAFHINAPGNYVVDWGEGPAMEYTHLDEISHTYLKGGTFKIGISGQQTSPMGPQSAPLPVISFQDNNFVKDVQGSFSAIFDQIEDYMFYETFNYCRELTNVDENLFQGINSATKGMFERTFASCYKLKEIPKGLFSNVSGTADNMFRQTFMDCYALTDVPTGLFDGINGAASHLFDGTFSFCKGLNSLPIDLFANVRGAADFLFHQTFMQCENLQNIPKGLFNGVNGAARDMFNYTFGGCRNITSIPTGLFDGVKGTAPFIFQGTFSDCEKLIEIPDDLFAGITSASEFMFAGTFYNCSNIKKLPNGLFKNISGKPGEMTFSSTFNSCLNMRGYIPVDTFANLDASDYVSGPMWGIFENTGLDTICPAGTYQYITGFEIDWSDKVSCAQCPYDGLGIPGETDSIAKCFKESECNSPAGFGTMRYYYNELTDSYDTPTECRFTQCNDGYYMLDGVCTDCPAGSYCTDDNIYSCPDGYTSDMRQDEQTDCYKNCKELDILYGTALPVNSIEIWPNDCEYQDCISTGNNVGTVVETKDGLICREYDCPYNQKMINGVCRPCDAEHAIEYDENAFENCTVKICEEGFEPYLDSCRPLQDACSAPYATKAYKYWDKTYASYGPCIIEECEAGRHIDANACELDVSPCDIKNGAGERVWNGTEWQECQIVQCEHGFTPDANGTACERCYNYFDENGDVAVSGYISECEIASCMYQGEKYILENNECRLICTNTTDETGSRYWNERTNKCEHNCAAGHMPW